MYTYQSVIFTPKLAIPVYHILHSHTSHVESPSLTEQEPAVNMVKFNPDSDIPDLSGKGKTIPPCRPSRLSKA